MRGQKLTRELRLLHLLEGRSGGVEIEELARELGTGRRTVYRDFMVLEGAGFPLVAERDGRRARWKMMPGYRSRLQLALTWSELLALSTLRRLAAGLAGTIFHDDALSALDKVRATLPRPLAERLRAAEALVSAAAAPGSPAGRSEIVSRLVEAIDRRLSVEARYRSLETARLGGRARERRLDPYHLHVTPAAVYLLGYCHAEREVRMFRADRFQELRLTGEDFTPPSDFDASAHLGPAFGMWRGRARLVRFVARGDAATLLMERPIHPSQVAQRRTDGSVEVRLRVAVGPPLVAWLTGMGGEVARIEPAALAEAVARRHASAPTSRARGVSVAVTRRNYGRRRDGTRGTR